jgi:hypothetical protein
VVTGSENRFDGLGQHFYFEAALKERAAQQKQTEEQRDRVKV